MIPLIFKKSPVFQECQNSTTSPRGFTKLANESLLLPTLGAAGGVCGDDGAPKLFVGDGGVETFPLVAKLENESLFPVGVDGVDGGAPKLLLAFALAVAVDGAPKFEFGADCCLAK